MTALDPGAVAGPGLAPPPRPSVDWANAEADGAPDLRTELPGPRSLENFERLRPYQYGSFFQLINLLPISFAEGHGVTLTDVDGNRYLDFTHGHMAAGLGHGHPLVAEAIGRQAGRLMNIRDFPSPERAELCERLAEITPGDLNVFQFFGSGTETAEAAMRVARAATGGHEFLSVWNDYHGRTPGAAAAGTNGNLAIGPRMNGYHAVPGAFCYRCDFGLTHPGCGLHCADFAERSAVNNSSGALAGIFLEPITNASGARVYPDGYLRRMRDIADRNSMLLLLDEHATFGRTGTWFAAQHEDVVADAVMFGKWLGNGFPVTVLAVREKYRDVLQQTQPSSTFGGQPLACAVALAALNVIQAEGLIDYAAELGATCIARLREIEAAHPSVGQVRGKGLLMAIDFVESKASRRPNPQAANAFYVNALRRGVVVSGGASSNVRINPMVVMSQRTALRGLDILEDAITAMELELGYGG
jgi:4-aminobutyrate aminotransferase/4-aminobutyrate aminotransferase/(S)-3-amino-2-methylpropionate transaminase